MTKRKTKDDIIRELTEQRDAACVRYSRAIALFTYFNLDPTEVTERDAPVDVFVQFKKDIEEARAMVKRREPETAQAAVMGQSFNEVLGDLRFKKKSYIQEHFSLDDIARFIKQCGFGEVKINGREDYL